MLFPFVITIHVLQDIITFEFQQFVAEEDDERKEIEWAIVWKEEEEEEEEEEKKLYLAVLLCRNIVHNRSGKTEKFGCIFNGCW